MIPQADLHAQFSRILYNLSMGCVVLLLILIVVLPLVFALIFLNVITISFGKLGLSPEAAMLLLFFTLAGSLVNIPISSRQVAYEEPITAFSRFFFYIPPKVTRQVIAVNVGGAVVPLGFALYLLPKAPLVPTALATAAVAVVSRLLARVVPGLGIVMPAWIPPLLSAGLAILMVHDNPAPAAYISGTMGTLIGADLLNWGNFRKLGAQMISIGGAGVFDGIFLAGLVAALIA